MTYLPNDFKPLLATDENMPYILMGMDASDELGVDTETSGLNVRNKIDYLMGICIDGASGISAYLPLRHPDQNINMARWMPHIVEILEKKPLDWHNLKFDYHSFTTIGVDPLKFKGTQFCSMIAASLVDEELWSKELDALAKKYLRLEKYETDLVHQTGKIYGFANIPSYMYQNYGPWDARLTRMLANYFRGELRKQDLESVYYGTEIPFNRLLYVLEQRGVGVNSPLAEEKATIGRGRMATIYRELGFNAASPTDLKRVLLQDLNLPVLAHTKSCERCKEGQVVDSHDGPPSFDKAAMEDYDEILQNSNNPTAKLISEYRGWQKATTALYEPLLEKVGPDGRVRTEYHQHRAVTGRLSSSNPNLQQIPRSTPKPWNGNAKSCFITGNDPDEWAHYGWDWSQIELRLAASYGSEALLLTEFEKDTADPFSALAPGIFGYLDAETRHRTKNQFVYPSLYGAGLRKIALSSGLPTAEVAPLYENYKATIPGIISISQQVTNLIQKRGYVRYWDGRRRHIKDRRKAYKGFNAVCQGGAAQLMKVTMLRCQEFETDEAYMMLTVHDEISWAIKRKLIPEYDKLVTKAMCDWDFGVRLAVEGKEWK